MRQSLLFPAVLGLLLGLAGCSGSKDEGGSAGGGSTGPRPTEVAEPGESIDLSGLRVHQDLLATAHLADVDRGGLFLDFGTPAHGKYTFGDWGGNNNSSQWGADGTDGDTTFTNVGGRGRIYFHSDVAGPAVARVRLKANPGVTVSPFLNNTALPGQPAPTGAFADLDVPLPAVTVGDNYLLLLFGGSAGAAPAAGSVFASIDSIRIVPGTTVPAGAYVPPTYDTLVRDVRLGSETRPSLALRRGTRLSHYVHVPAGAKLVFGLGADGGNDLPFKVVASAEGKAARDVFTGRAGGAFRDVLVDLSGFADEVVRLDFVAEGDGAGTVAVAKPALYVAAPREGRLRMARNVVVLLIDTLRADRLHAWNPRTRVRTPTMDALAGEGTLFENAHATENWTKPTVGSVLTGLYPRTHRARATESVLPSSALMISEHLKSNGFRTASFVANGYISERFGFRQGWDYHTNYIRENKGTDAEIVFREAGDWIEQNKGQRFFTYIHTIDPHVPYDPPAEYLRMYDARTDYTGVVQPRSTAELLEQAKRRPPGVQITPSDQQRLEALHDGEITQHDAVFGRFLERLKALGVWEDTLFILTADHGEEFRDHDSWGHGHSVYEELLHVPLYVRLPGVVPGQRVRDSVSPIHIPATITELTGVPAMPRLEAGSLVDYFRGTVPVGPRVAFSDWTDDRRVITVAGRYKLIVRGNFTSTLFDLVEDPGEKTPLELASRPIASRFCRIYLGVWNGARNRAQWLDAVQEAGQQLQAQDAVMDAETQAQLRALGYANGP